MFILDEMLRLALSAYVTQLGVKIREVGSKDKKSCAKALQGLQKRDNKQSRRMIREPTLCNRTLACRASLGLVKVVISEEKSYRNQIIMILRKVYRRPKHDGALLKI